ncbi:MAG: class I SAM-dependent methyltransferase family protein [Anaeromyxobacter sp.]|nr:class I SAM-dependent methyltransferase family protein [Anaeromyxobacter sp.]MBL0278406.1 class I SAM-dependent methyltransferase family protein [Anaeromyxobacter sp.]
MGLHELGDPGTGVVDFEAPFLVPAAAGSPAAQAVAAGPGAAPPRVRRYEELDGAVGRGVFFRPQRFSAEDLAPLTAAVTVTVAGARRECALVDVSQNGVAVAWPADLPVSPGQRLPAALRFDDHAAFTGEAHVGSVRQKDGLTVVGLSFVDFLLDVDEIHQLRAVRAWAPAGAGGPLERRPWRLAGHEKFKSLVSELGLYLEDARRELTAFEAELPWHVLNGPANPARAALVSRLRAGFVADVVDQTEQVDAALRQIPGGLANAAAREWSLRHLHDHLLQALSCQRALHKPFGYPGDYELMNFIYERQFEGPNLFARAVGLAFLSTRAPAAVRCRKDVVKAQLAALLARRAGSKEPVRVLSIAAGPAQELFELFEAMEDLPVPVEVVLFEQDRHALAHAWRRLRSTAVARFPEQVRCTFLHDSVKRLLRDEDLFADFGQFDLVYSCGLLDYFQRATATVLVRRLAAATRPGGQLLVANMVDHPIRWVMEWHLDWNLIYRTREDLLEIGWRAAPTAQARILEEASGANPFFELIPE